MHMDTGLISASLEYGNQIYALLVVTGTDHICCSGQPVVRKRTEEAVPSVRVFLVRVFLEP